MVITAADVNIADYIDHSLLNPLATGDDIDLCCNQAIDCGFPVVCVYPVHVKRAVAMLHSQKITVATVIGFPTGATTPGVKLHEAQEATNYGAGELDVVINLGWLKSGKFDWIHKEIASICEETGIPVKAILETTRLTDEEKQMAAQVCLDAGVRFLKTSTGWFGGATVEDVAFLHDICKGRVGIKASGGIKDLESAIALINAGANRLGTSRGVDIVRQQKENLTV
ncbi:deoxyribose-phosphate aldolase [Cyanobacterium stanieri LEGE 03274]|uniref:Deoxyribose-phosphate aldolase n=1 Tax=Cyanobacterium stanieri LEGE 03274 TaxID=1828756 RepID=A0ABR9V087_9CHRO|nr:deoxyribose-phosphate aldolase [Cyanobacterium stanieri]MBE9221283.1 deoxyribose-phosphate aldolase [Cyanobacterium stanieri LEGE 03274]